MQLGGGACTHRNGWRQRSQVAGQRVQGEDITVDSGPWGKVKMTLRVSYARVLSERFIKNNDNDKDWMIRRYSFGNIFNNILFFLGDS